MNGDVVAKRGVPRRSSAARDHAVHVRAAHGGSAARTATVVSLGHAPTPSLSASAATRASASAVTLPLLNHPSRCSLSPARPR